MSADPAAILAEHQREQARRQREDAYRAAFWEARRLLRRWYDTMREHQRGGDPARTAAALPALLADTRTLLG